MARRRKRKCSRDNHLYLQLVEAHRQAEQYRRLLATRERQYDELFELAGQLVTANRELAACLRAEVSRGERLKEHNAGLQEQVSEWRAKERRAK